MATSDLRAEVEIWPFCACGMHASGQGQFGYCGLGYGADRPTTLQNVLVVFKCFDGRVLSVFCIF